MGIVNYIYKRFTIHSSEKYERQEGVKRDEVK